MKKNTWIEEERGLEFWQWQQAHSALAYSREQSILLCGDYIEINYTRNNVLHGMRAKPSEGQREPETPEQINERASARARRTVRRLVNSNYLFWMTTLTLAPDVSKLDSRNGEKWKQIPLEEQKDRAIVINLWDRFRRRAKKHFNKDFPYVAIIEKHTGKRAKDETIKRGTYHIHFCTVKRQDMTSRDFEIVIQNLWRHGLCKVSDWTKGRRSRDLGEIDSPPPSNPGAYLSKYFGEKGDDSTGRSRNDKRYWSSRGLIKPEQVEWHQIERYRCDLLYSVDRETDEGVWLGTSETYKIKREDLS